MSMLCPDCEKKYTEELRLRLVGSWLVAWGEAIKLATST